MIEIRTSKAFLVEKKYITDIVLGEFLGLDHQVVPQEDIGGYEIVLENGNKIMIKDDFFKHLVSEPDYLPERNIPEKVEFVKNPFLAESDIPVIYGNDELVVSRDKIVCGIDIFASSFFMLTRWEEYANKIRDKHGRFPANASLACRNGFLDRPVVNEYVEMLWNMLLKLAIQERRKERKFDMLLTHDVDNILKYKGALGGCKEIYGDLLKNFNLPAGFRKMKEKLLTHVGLKKDPFDTFDYLMNISENTGLKSHFFLMGQGTSRYDNNYRVNGQPLKEIIRKIKSRGHDIGLHATYNAYNDRDQFCAEKIDIEKRAGMPVKTGRQHYLRFEAPMTWQVWENNGMEWDSTLSYADREGFRCGTCYEYSVFNFLTREKLKLKEKPLIVMDGSFVTYQPEITPLDMQLKIQALVDKCRKYKGTFVFLWHNSSFNTDEWRPFQSVYEDIIMRNMGRDL